MPCAAAKGLLPGRGVPVGRCPMPCEEAKGLLPGRGAPGRGPPGFAASPDGASPAAGAAGVDGAAGAAGAAAAGASVFGAGAAGAAGAFGPGAACFGAGALGASDVTAGAAGAGAFGAAGPGVGAPGVAGRAAGAAGAAEAVAPEASRAARSLRATGGSMLDEGPLTNSPNSLSFAIAILLSTPSSDAISCTRGFAATILLSELAPRQGQALVVDGAHFEPLMSCPLAVQPVLSECRTGWGGSRMEARDPGLIPAVGSTSFAEALSRAVTIVHPTPVCVSTTAEARRSRRLRPRGPISPTTRGRRRAGLRRPSRPSGATPW